MAEDDPLTLAVQASLQRQAALGDAAEQLARRREAIWRLGHEPRPGHDQPMTAADVTLALRAALLDKGLSPAEVDALGVGYHSVQKIIKGPSPSG